MRASIPLLVATVSLGLVTADLVRRVGVLNAPRSFRLTQSQRTAFFAESGYDLVLQSFDGTVSTLDIVVRPQTKTAIANVTLEEVSLGGKLPDEPLPLCVVADAAGVATLHLHFRGVVWAVSDPDAGGSAPGYEAHFTERTTVLFAGCDPVDEKTGSRAYPLRLTKGPGHADLVRLRGGR